MADKKITALTDLSATNKAGEDFLHIIDYGGGSAPVNKKISLTNLFSTIPVNTSIVGANTSLEVKFGASTNSALKVTNAGTGTAVGTVVVNDDATAYVDFTVKTNNSASGIFVDSSTDTVTINGDNANLDFIVNGDTASYKTIHSDASFDAVGIGNPTLDGNYSLQVGADATTGGAAQFGGWIAINSVENLTGGASSSVVTVNSTKAWTKFNVTGSTNHNIELPTDAKEGQIKIISITAGSGNATLTLSGTNRLGTETVELQQLGDTWTGIWDDTINKWININFNNVA